VTLSVLIGDPPPHIFTYDPRTTSPDEVKSWIDEAKQKILQVENKPDSKKS